jgi:putative endonuclease
MISNKYAVYIITNKRNTTLYVGMTENLARRIKQHKGQHKGFTAKYNIDKLVYYEFFKDRKSVMKREKQIKNLLRKKKETLINKFNSGWKDLYPEVLP